jgi:hypothetical protein
MTRVRTAITACVLVALALSVGCASVDARGGPAEPDRATFDADVWPVLVRDCGFSACHGSDERFFRVLGPGHERLDPEMRLGDPVTDAELQLSYDRARSMIDADHPARSLLLKKPLEVSAGGSGHEGTDSFGIDVYGSADDPSYRILTDWVLGTAP